MPEKSEIYKGEIILACHEAARAFAQKHGLQYSNAEGHSLPFLEQMASNLAEALQHCNPDREIVIHDAFCSPEEMERRKKLREEVSKPTMRHDQYINPYDYTPGE